MQIDPALYWEFRTRVREQQATQAADRVARERLEAVAQRIEAAYPLIDLNAPYRWNDATCELVPAGQDVDQVAKPLATVGAEEDA